MEFIKKNLYLILPGIVAVLAVGVVCIIILSTQKSTKKVEMPYNDIIIMDLVVPNDTTLTLKN